jgi:hypothetical protein
LRFLLESFEGLLPGHGEHRDPNSLHGYCTAMVAGAPAIQATLNWIVALPFVVSGGSLKFTW